jgi:hypothetical protein
MSERRSSLDISTTWQSLVLISTAVVNYSVNYKAINKRNFVAILQVILVTRLHAVWRIRGCLQRVRNLSPCPLPLVILI